MVLWQQVFQAVMCVLCAVWCATAHYTAHSTHTTAWDTCCHNTTNHITMYFYWSIPQKNSSFSKAQHELPENVGTALPFQTRLTRTKPVLPLSHEHGSKVKDQGRRQCCHNRHTKFPYWSTHGVFTFLTHASYVRKNYGCLKCITAIPESWNN